MGNNKKQTAVDYILDNIFYPIDTNEWNRVFAKAKQMEKEQLIVAYEEGRADILQEVHRDATYGKGY